MPLPAKTRAPMIEAASAPSIVSQPAANPRTAMAGPARSRTTPASGVGFAVQQDLLEDLFFEPRGCVLGPAARLEEPQKGAFELEVPETVGAAVDVDPNRRLDLRRQFPIQVAIKVLYGLGALQLPGLAVMGFSA